VVIAKSPEYVTTNLEHVTINPMHARAHRVLFKIKKEVLFKIK